MHIYEMSPICVFDHLESYIAYIVCNSFRIRDGRQADTTDCIIIPANAVGKS